MGSGRKRPADRSPTPSRDGEGRKKDSTKNKKKKAKTKHKESNSTEQTHKSSLESTATAEGQIMAQVLSTFNRLEQSRFEAFRRATFPTDAVSGYVAHCLIEQQAPTLVGKRPPVLSALVAPGQAPEIATVVGTLAKKYAQRLVTAARSRKEQHDGNTNTPISPQAIWAAFQERQAQGLDPGFFFCNSGGTVASRDSLHLPIHDSSHDKRRLAALQAQDDYDREHGNPDGTKTKDGKDNIDDDVSMEMSTPTKQADALPASNKTSPLG